MNDVFKNYKFIEILNLRNCNLTCINNLDGIPFIKVLDLSLNKITDY